MIFNRFMFVWATLNKTIRVGLFALLCLFSISSTVNAHALPGSVITLSEQQYGALKVEISFPLEDLIIAAPELEVLAKVDVEQKIPPKLLKQLSQYLQAHMFMLSGTEKLKLLPQQAEIDVVYNQHLGHFRSLAVELLAEKVPQEPPFSLSLSYDVIMHEIRNHRAEVYWKKGNKTIKLSNFGFKKVEGKPVIHHFTNDLNR
ncbi:hypothetical protein [Psychromonas arctica]|uniref:hypothetical protein n=1 Tax=Psychromonas arctica TaxID=168275 RepID=UPI002FD604C3